MSEHFIQANALNIPLADRSVQMCVTSPPYYGLRDYGTATWEGGDAECDHNPQRPDGGDRADRTLPLGRGGMYRDTCAKCGAIRVDNQIGLEQTHDCGAWTHAKTEQYIDFDEDGEQYIASRYTGEEYQLCGKCYVCNMVAVFREVRRVLRDDGTVWLNLGDSYNGSSGNGGKTEKQVSNKGSYHDGGIRNAPGLKPKDLIGIPWRVAFALQADGWWLRSDIIWDKPNPMPESVRDRPTKAHEYVFLLTKSQRYYYDYQAILETASYDGRKDEQFKGAIKSYNGVMPGGKPQSFAQNGHPRWNKDNNGNRVRNKRTVWHVATAPYKGAHYATYPPKLIEPCILAGSRQGDIVLDPFNGSGTTGLVARKHGRNYIGTDLSLEYIHQAEERLSHTALKNRQRGKAVETTDLGPLFEVMA